MNNQRRKKNLHPVTARYHLGQLDLADPETSAEWDKAFTEGYAEHDRFMAKRREQSPKKEV